MEDFLDAIRLRFNGYSPLVAVARKLYVGFATTREKSLLPYVVATASATDDWGFNFQLVYYALEFSLCTKHETPKACNTIIRRMKECFDWCTLNGPFTTVGFIPGEVTTPTVEDGVYRASMLYDVTLQLPARNPQRQVIGA